MNNEKLGTETITKVDYLGVVEWWKSALRLKEALEAILERYTSLAESGDAGHWDYESEPEVIAARKEIEFIEKVRANAQVLLDARPKVE